MAFGSSSKGVLSITTSAAGGSFLVLEVSGREQLNQLSEYRVECVGELIPVIDRPKPVVVALLLGTQAEVKMEIHDEKRYISGYITRVAEGERHGRYRRYALTLRPWLWFATRTCNSKVFQKKSVKDIVTEVLQPYGGTSDWRLMVAALYPKLDYCVQYNESDFDFVSRLLQRAGINYFFEYSSGTHKLVFVDSNSMFKPKQNSDPVRWADALKHDACMSDWKASQEVRTQKVVVRDHDYLATATTIEGTKSAVKIPPIAKLGPSEWFEYPADVVQNSQQPTTTAATTAASNRASWLLQSLGSMQQTWTGHTNTRDIAVGATFQLTEHVDSEHNKQYIVVGATFTLRFADHEAIAELKAVQRNREGFIADVVCAISTGDDVRPEMRTPKPVMRGPQTALVVGASGNEIETDKNGRVKVQFFWDRLGTNDQDSSCWVRVATPWASKNYGMISLPRVGDEVVVDFVEGDPDKPIITGSLYNDVNPPIYELPANATMSGIKTRSSKSGTADNANELRFEDKKDSEYVWFQAEKDFYRYVKKDSYEWVGQNETLKTVKDRKDVVGEAWSLDVGKDVMHNFGKDLHLTVAGDIFYNGKATWQVKLAKDLNSEVGGDVGAKVTGKFGVKATGNILLTSDAEVHIKGTSKIAAEGAQISLKATGGVVIDCPAGVTLKCGGSLVALTPAGVDIVGTLVNINSGGGGGSAGSATAASPTAPNDAKKLDDITPSKSSDYDKNFDDPLKKK
jgi:type VI secretion system secreted protein VgrG